MQPLHSDFAGTFIFQTDASGFYVGAVFIQRENEDQPIAYIYFLFVGSVIAVGN